MRKRLHLLGRPGAAVLAGLVAIALGWGSFVTFDLASTRGERSTADRESMAEIDMIEIRTAMGVALLAEANARTLAGVGAASVRSVDEAIDGRSRTLDDQRTALSELAASDGPTAREAQQFLAEFDDVVDDIPSWSVESTYDMSGFVRYAERRTDLSERARALDEFTIFEVLPMLVLDVAIGAHVLVDDLAVDDTVDRAVSQRVEGVRSEGGRLTTDPSTPFEELSVFELDRARSELPTEMDAASSILSESGIVAEAEWIRSISTDEPLDRPSTLERTVETFDAAGAELRTLVSETLDRERAELRASESQARTEQTQMTILAFVLVALAAAALTLTISILVRIARRSHRQARLATVDPLTGVGNRHLLESRTRALAVDDRYVGSLVAIVDLDRFKMVNDVHGHAAGDAVLTAIARELDRCGEDMTRWYTEAEHTTIRLGGDEFLLTLHASETIDAVGVRDRIEQIRQSSITLDDGVELALEFSLGLAGAGRGTDLGSVMRAADLAGYEDKARRANVRCAGAKPDDRHDLVVEEL